MRLWLINNSDDWCTWFMGGFCIDCNCFTHSMYTYTWIDMDGLMSKSREYVKNISYSASLYPQAMEVRAASLAAKYRRPCLLKNNK